MGATSKDKTSDPSRFSREPRETHANSEMRFTKNARSGDFATNRHN